MEDDLKAVGVFVVMVIVVILLICHKWMTNDSRAETQRSLYSARPAYEPYTRRTQGSYLVQESSKILDLHNYRLRDAIVELDMFLSRSIAEYRRSNYSGEHRFVNIITGRGNHSENHIPVIKQEVEKYLKRHNYKFYWNNPGIAGIDLKSKRLNY